MSNNFAIPPVSGGGGSATPTSAQFSALSQKVSTLSHNLSTLSQAVSVADAALSGRVNSVNSFLSGISARSVGDISTHGIQSVINALSNRISAGGGGGGSVTSQELSVVAAGLSVRIDTVSNGVSVVSNALSNEISNRISADNVLSNGISVVSNALSNEISNRTSAVNVVSNAVSVVSNALSNEISNRISADNALSQAISVLSQAVSVADAALSGRVNSVNSFLSGISARSVGDISTHGIQSVINALSNRISAGGGGGGSVTSQELSVVAAALSARIDTVSNGVSVVSNALSNEISNRISAINVVSNAASDALSVANAASNAASIADDHASTASAAATSADAHADTASAAATSADAHADAASAAATSVDNRLNSIVSVFLSATGPVVPQIRTRNGSVSVITTAILSDIASMSISCAVGKYLIDGAVMFECATSGGIQFGLSLPPLLGAGSYVQMNCMSAAQAQNTPPGIGVRAFSAIAAGQATIVSVSITTVNVIRSMNFRGMIDTSAAGTIQIMAAVSVTAASLSIRGGYIRAYRIV